MKRCFFTIADNNNLKYAQMMANSLKKFHPDIEIVLFGEDQVKATGDPHFYYRATPALAKTLFDQGFDEVCKLDADTVITGNLDHIWEGDFDVAVVNNSNPKEDKSYPIRLWNINPMAYVNCGFVVMKSKPFVDHWMGLCYSEHFQFYQYKEQDLLNIMVFYQSLLVGGQYKVKFLDKSDKWHGLISKQFWPNIELRDQLTEMKDNPPIKVRGKGLEIKQTGYPLLKEEILVLPKNEEWPIDQDKKIVAIHWAGGNQPGKMNFKLHFKPEVIKKLEELVK